METTEIKELEEKVKSIIDEMRPFFEEDGGDVRLVEVTPDGIAKVRLLGACKDCEMSDMTVKGGIQGAVLEKIPEIKSVEAIVE